ncbi:HEXXH motif-containing putative peptide modification protein [Flavobacterium sp. MEB061]|jgi:HEXXH motif-containing protein|uniref:aKG-HExxH-type peptide beta-hydroxylase n=1 Tax=Flavobacterium sp. MEB061 TaxID=1587524 RepID=UPI00069843C1|nr:HEXXH motif-containing putative peptide modification protein [Flavobacterium sp. MEB061]
MSLKHKINAFIASPYPLWEDSLTEDLIEYQWTEFGRLNIWPSNYSTARALFWDASLPDSDKILIFQSDASVSTQLEMPQQQMDPFYDSCGLEMIQKESLNSNDAKEKLSKAFALAGTIENLQSFLVKIVKNIQIVEQHDPEIDTSHSDPKIAFSIFVTICPDSSEISSLRVAESIVHEAMHLKLTLIEKHEELAILDTAETFYSPWRDENRPVKGVLHGLFVFCAVLDMYETLMRLKAFTCEAVSFIDMRICSIKDELNLLTDFPQNPGLTTSGKSLAASLLNKYI